MTKLALLRRCVVCLIQLALAACDDASDAPRSTRSDAGTDASGAAPPDAALVDASYSCEIAPDCEDLDVGIYTTKACCSPVTSCGYELPPLDEDTITIFPQSEEFYAMVVGGDPMGRCAPESFFFGPRPGLWEHRVVVDGGEDILITPSCPSYTVLAFILPGCCLPDDTCGLSTDESWPTLASLVQGEDAGFARPECVTADELNQQFLDSVVLEDFARTTTRGRCNYAAIAAATAP